MRTKLFIATFSLLSAPSARSPDKLHAHHTSTPRQPPDQLAREIHARLEKSALKEIGRQRECT